MTLLDFKSKVSKNELMRRSKIDMMQTYLLKGSVNINTCACGHWAIRHLRLFGTSCEECSCISFKPLGYKDTHPKLTQIIERFLSVFYRKDNATP